MRSFDDPTAPHNKMESLEKRLKWTQEAQALTSRILTLLSRQVASRETIREILGMVKDFTEIEAVGIRLRDGEDFPYYETRRFPEYFVEMENSLCDHTATGEIIRDDKGVAVLECMCGDVLRGRIDPALPFFTNGGSFWSNCTIELLATTSEEERQTRTRNRCNGEGYESVALIPVRSDHEILGLLQLNDSRRNCFTPEMIQFFEGIGLSIGIVLQHQRVEQDRDRLFSLSIDMLGVVGFDGFFKQINPAFTKTLGWAREEFLAKPATYFIHPEDLEETIAAGSRLLLGEPLHELENRFRCKDGSYRWIAWNGFPIPEENLIFAMGRDVTELKQREDELRKINTELEQRVEQRTTALQESEARFRKVFEQGPLGMAILDLDYRCIAVNPTLCDMVGYTEDELTKLTFLDITHPDDIQADLEQHKKVLCGEIQVKKLEKRYITKKGEIIWVRITGSVVRDDQGKALYFLAMIGDITDRKRTEEALVQAKRDWEETFDSITDMITVHDRDFNIIRKNKAAQKILGLPELLPWTGAKCYEYYHGKNSPPQSCPSCHCLATGDEAVFEMFEPHLKMFVEIRAIPRLDANGELTGLIHVVRDITDRKRAEEERARLESQLLQAQKMEAIGTLAGGIAHDFNNLLTIVLGFSELLLLGRDERDPSHADLQKINQAARNGAELVQRILAFSRRTEINPRPLNLNREIEQLQELLSRTIPKMIKIKLRLSSSLATVLADPIQVEQILMNMAVNAKDAMPDGGKLTIQTKNVALDEEYCRMHLGAEAGNYVLVSVSDTGHGMDPETSQHIFEPFFTTKATGKGTGLGLAMVYGIVKQHNGHITCDSKPGMGTEFRIYLPAIEAEAESTPHPDKSEFSAGTETILLVDDEEMVRDLGTRILRGSGYTVLTAASGHEALELFRKEGHEISLVILDLIMPEMGGKQCLTGLLEIDSNVKVVITSGYSTDGQMKETLEMGAKSFVGKPYNVGQMLQAVRDVLDAE